MHRADARARRSVRATTAVEAVVLRRREMQWVLDNDAVRFRNTLGTVQTHSISRAALRPQNMQAEVQHAVERRQEELAVRNVAAPAVAAAVAQRAAAAAAAWEGVEEAEEHEEDVVQLAPPERDDTRDTWELEAPPARASAAYRYGAPP